MRAAPMTAPASPPSVLFGDKGDSGRRAQAIGRRKVPPAHAATSAAAAAKAMRNASCHSTTRCARDQGIQIEAKPAIVALLRPCSTSPDRTAGTAHASTVSGASAMRPGRNQAANG